MSSRALVAALRREEAAAKHASRLEGELAGLQDLLKVKDSELQRAQMMAKLKEARLARLQGGQSPVPALWPLQAFATCIRFHPYVSGQDVALMLYSLSPVLSLLAPLIIFDHVRWRSRECSPIMLMHVA